MLDGKQKDIKRTKDDSGNPFKTERAAIKARQVAIVQVQTELLHPPKPVKKRITVAEVYAEYCETGRCGKAYGTTRKQDSLWKNHISKRFGKRYVDDNAVVDAFFKGNIELINNFMMALAEEQIKAAFKQSEKEVTDLHSRISQGMREAKKNGTKIGLSKGSTLTTKKSIDCKAIIQKHSKDFGGSLEDPDVLKLCGCSRNSYYKYKKEIKTN